MKLGQKNSNSLSYFPQNNGDFMSKMVCGTASVLTTFAVVNSMDYSLLTNILVSIISAIVFAGINIITKIITTRLEKRGLISKVRKKDIDDIVDDLADDGKKNNSNKK